MGLLKCAACGFENTEGSNFCKQCGEPVTVVAVNQADADPTKEPAQKKSVIQMWKDSEVENRYGSLKSIGTIYKVFGFIVGLVILFLTYRIYTDTGEIWMALVFMLLCSPITMIISAQAEKIDMSIAQEKSMRECSLYLKTICEHLEQPKK